MALMQSLYIWWWYEKSHKYFKVVMLDLIINESISDIHPKMIENLIHICIDKVNEGWN